RLRPVQAGRGAWREPVRGDRRHAELHAPRAGRRGERADHGGRRLRAGRHPLRPAHGSAAVQGRDAAGDGDPGPRKRPGSTAGAQSARGPRPGNDLPEVPGQGAGPALPLGGGAGRRPGALAGRRADPGPAERGLGTGAEAGPAQAGAGGAGLGLAVPGLVTGALLYQGQRARVAEKELGEYRRTEAVWAKAQAFLLKGEEAAAAQRWQDAQRHAASARAVVSAEPSLADLA